MRFYCVIEMVEPHKIEDKLSFCCAMQKGTIKNNKVDPIFGYICIHE